MQVGSSGASSDARPLHATGARGPRSRGRGNAGVDCREHPLQFAIFGKRAQIRFNTIGWDRRDLLEIVEDRCGRGATLIASQIPVDRWHDLIGDPTIADAVLDRIIHSAHRIKLRGDSLRKKAAASLDA